MKPNHQTTPITIAIMACFACFVWSTGFVAIKIGLKHTGPLSFAGVRFMLSGLLLPPFCWKKVFPLNKMGISFKTLALLSLFQTSLLFGCLFVGMTMVSGALGAIIIGSSPLIAAIVAHFYMKGDEMTLGKFLSIGIGIGGIILISLSKHPWSPGGPWEFIGIMLLLLGTTSSAMGNIIVARDENNMDPVALNTVQMFMGGVTLFIISIPVEGLPPVDSLPFAYYSSLVWLAITSAASFTIWFILLKKPGVKVSELNLWKFVIPVSGATISWIILPEESPNLASVFGMACVASSIVLFNLSLKFGKAGVKAREAI